MYDFNAKDASQLNGKFSRLKDIPNYRYLTAMIKSLKVSGLLLVIGMTIADLTNMVLQFKEQNRSRK